MGTRGRKSTAEMSVVVPIDTRRKKLEPPADLKAEEAQIFRQLVSACAPDHFVKSDIPLLVAYCTSIHLSRWAADAIESDNSFFTTWERATRMIATLATRLRLAPQARIDARAAGRSTRTAPDDERIWEKGWATRDKPKPWEV